MPHVIAPPSVQTTSRIRAGLLAFGILVACGPSERERELEARNETLQTQVGDLEDRMA